MKLLITGGSGFIGTNLIEYYLQNLGCEHLLSVDVREPKIKEHYPLWHQVDILDENKLEITFEKFHPTHVVHLAAITDSSFPNLIDYRANTLGTQNVLSAIKKNPSILRSIITSTQFVCKPGTIISSDVVYNPHTIYGQSKVITEETTRNFGLESAWTIIRPTNIWGPWHPRYPYEFWKILKQGLYFHPGQEQVIRSYGYVGNVIYQINKILESPAEKVNQQTYYVGDQPINLYDWANGFSLAIAHKKVHILPRKAVYFLAIIGDVLSKLKIKFPITSSRYESMTQNYPAPMEKTFETFGLPPYSLEEGIKITVDWLRANHYPDIP
jgi:nucleoside-diphosphate-sugar epimerase